MSFHTFTAVRILKVSPKTLFSHGELHHLFESDSITDHSIRNRLLGTLPPNMETLCFTESQQLLKQHLYPGISSLAQQKSRYTPHLKEAIFEGRFPTGRDEIEQDLTISLANSFSILATVKHEDYSATVKLNQGLNGGVTF